MRLNKVLSTIGIASIIGISAVGAIVSRAKEQDFQVLALDNSEQKQEDVLSEFDFRVVELRNNGILIGDENGNLNLGSGLKRQEMIVLLSRLMGKEAEAKNWNTSNLTFADVQKDNWATPYIAWAKENNITKGYSDELFGYDDYLTEKQAAMFLLRVLGYEAEQDDVEEKAIELEIIGYYEELKDETIKREKLVKYIYNILYTNKNNEEKTLAAELGIESVYTYEESELALYLESEKIQFNSLNELNGWKMIYVTLDKEKINEEKINEEIGFFAMIGNILDYNNYVLVNLDTNDEIEVINYKEQGVIYRIKLNDKVVYEFTGEEK